MQVRQNQMDLTIQICQYDEHIKINDETTFLYCEINFLYIFILTIYLYTKIYEL